MQPGDKIEPNPVAYLEFEDPRDIGRNIPNRIDFSFLLENLGMLVYQMRKSMSMNKTKAAKRIGVDPGRLSRLEDGDYMGFTLYSIYKFILFLYPRGKQPKIRKPKPSKYFYRKIAMQLPEESRCPRCGTQHPRYKPGSPQCEKVMQLMKGKDTRNQAKAIKEIDEYGGIIDE